MNTNSADCTNVGEWWCLGVGMSMERWCLGVGMSMERWCLGVGMSMEVGGGGGVVVGRNDLVGKYPRIFVASPGTESFLDTPWRGTYCNI